MGIFDGETILVIHDDADADTDTVMKEDEQAMDTVISGRFRAER
jgi:hypothetical protein